MALQDKYSKLIDYARSSSVQNLAVNEQDGVLRISGDADAQVKDRIWDLYSQLDPDMRAGDLVLNIRENPGSRQEQHEEYEVKPGDSLSKIATKYSGITWQQIFEANKDILKDPDKIYPGQKLKIPVKK